MKLAGAAAVTAALTPATRASAATPNTTWHSWIDGPSTPSMTSFDNAMLDFMKARGITDGSLAVTTGGRLVKASGYTLNATRTPPVGQRVAPTTLFRIASISKSVTATAVNRLAQEGRLNLDTPIDQLIDLTSSTGHVADTRLDQVTVRRVLHHLGGWGDPLVTGFDPMIADAQIAGNPSNLPVTQRQIIKYRSGWGLDNEPGTFAYSNYGYMLLGRVIEAVTGLAYADYAQQAVLGPIGITRMRIGHSAASLPLPTESPYQTTLSPTTTVLNPSGAQVPWPYGGFNLENMDSHGGWLASAVDLVRFSSIFDGNTSVLNPGSVGATFARQDTPLDGDGYYYGYGWFIRSTNGAGVGYNAWHNGSLPGSWTWLVRCYNGRTWSALFNRRDDSSDGSANYNAIDSALWNAADAVTQWPTNDLYPQYFS
jgi:CubicO group peptidase (beta-lactamase class C family)